MNIEDVGLHRVFKTSKGLFWDRTEAEKKINRAPIFGSRVGDPVEYEPVVKTFVLEIEGQCFALTPADIR